MNNGFCRNLLLAANKEAETSGIFLRFELEHIQVDFNISHRS